MGLDRFVTRLSLADKQVGFAADIDQCVGPFGVAGKGDDLALDLEAQPEAWAGTVVVHHVKRRNLDARRFAAFSDIEFGKVQRKFVPKVFGAGETCLHNSSKAALEARRPNDGERTLALGDVIGLQQKKRNSPDMVGMKVAEEDRLDVVARDRKFVHGDERACTSIDENIGVAAGEVQAGIESSAGAEG